MQLQIFNDKNGIKVIVSGFDDLNLFSLKCDFCNVCLLDGKIYDWDDKKNRMSVKIAIERHCEELEHWPSKTLASFREKLKLASIPEDITLDDW